MCYRILMFVAFYSIISVGYSQVVTIEKEALQAFYIALDGDGWTSQNDTDITNDWDFTKPITNSWYGVTLSGDGKHIIRIELEDNNLTGSIPPQIGNFTNLNSLDLRFNNLVGNVPNEVGNLTNLKNLWLRDNKLEGDFEQLIDILVNIPQLESLRIDYNEFTGTIPKEIQNMTSLRSLSLGINNLSGEIPPEIGNITSLTELGLNANDFEGNIPKELGKLVNLLSLELQNNWLLTGPIPEELGELKKLSYLYLYGNQLTGNIPTFLGTLTDLKRLFLRQNNLTGIIPVELTNLKKLTALDLSSNQLTGTIPDLTSTPISDFFWFSGNEFHFGDFENEFNYYLNTINDFKYSPQKKVNEIINRNVAQGQSITLTTTVRGSQNKYQWYKGNQRILGATDNSLIISDFQPSDEGVYSARITSDLVPGLTLIRNNITLTITRVAPNCTFLTSPVNEETNVSLTKELEWQPAPYANGYRLSIGTTPGGTELLDAYDNYNSTTYSIESLDENTTYYVSIIPYNDIGDALGCAEQRFTTGSLPECVSLTSPLHESTGVSFSTNLTWQAVSDANGYRISIGTTSGGTELLDAYDNYNSTVYSLENLDKNTTYYVSIIPYNNVGNTLRCTETYFTTLDLPNCTSLSNPINGATDASLTTELKWETISNATGYKISIGTTSGGAEVLSDYDNGNNTSYTVNFNEETTYYVSIIPYNNDGNAVGCLEEHFTTLGLPPQCTSLINPVNGATSVSFSEIIEWTPVSNVEGYRISIGTTPGGVELLDNYDNQENTKFNPRTLIPENSLIDIDFLKLLYRNTILYVTITPYNINGDAKECVSESFTTEDLPECVSLKSPLDKSTNVPLSTNLTWESVSKAKGYTISIGTSSGGVEIVDSYDNGNNTSYTPLKNLERNTTYYVSIISYNDVGHAIDCIEESFTTEDFPSCTSLIHPVDGATSVSFSEIIEWTPVSNAEGYRISIGTTSGGVEFLDNYDNQKNTKFDPINLIPEDSTIDIDFFKVLYRNTTIYLSIIPYNNVGDAIGCTEMRFTTEDLPLCTTLINPMYDSKGVSLSTNLNWESAFNATGYTVSIGTSPEGTEILNAYDVGNYTTYTPTEDFKANTTYYVSIIPYNNLGRAIGCVEERFTTAIRSNVTKYGFSPDGDGINEFWDIKDIENFPKNKVSVYNRWGNLVFEIKEYNNRDRVFDGTANKNRALGADRLPEGTYFFVIEINYENTISRSEGFLVLKR